MKKSWLFTLPALALPFVFTACDDDEGQTIELPAIIKNYLDNNYSNYEIEESEMDTLCTGTAVYEVELEINDDEEVDLTFNTEGALLFTESEISNSNLPAEVTSAIAANYAGHSVEEAERLDMADGSKQYEVELKSGSNSLDVLFAADGTVICEEAGDDDGE